MRKNTFKLHLRVKQGIILHLAAILNTILILTITQDILFSDLSTRISKENQLLNQLLCQTEN